MDARTGFVIYENAQHQPMYPASITKIMTALVVLENVDDLSEEVVFSEYAVMSLPYYASRLNVMAGETMTVYEALYGLMLPSGNDVANALAEHVSGSISGFVEHMNHRAFQLGAVNTQFVNACGLPGDNQHTTAYDMALIMREAIQHPVFNEVMSAPTFVLPPMESFPDFPEGREIWNTNLLIQNGDFHNPWVLGGKTGFTNAAQHTLVSHARRGDYDLIISVLYAPRRATFTDTTALLEHVFEMPIQTLFDIRDHSWQKPVMQTIEGEATEVGLINIEGANSLLLPLPPGTPAIRHEIYIPAHLTAPVRSGDVVGYKSFYAGDELIAEVELISKNTVLPRMAAPPRPRQEVSITPPITSDNSHNLVFFALLPVVTFILLAALYVLMQRHRRIMLRRRRRMSRIRYARYGGLE